MSGKAAGLPRAVLDTNVIYSRVLHELFGRVASEGRLLDLVWSDELLVEAQRVLQERKPMPEAAARRWVGLLREAFPGGRVDPARMGHDLASLTVDPDDEFVCALALAAAPAYLVTFDRGYLAETLSSHGVVVVHPDAWLVAAIDGEPEVFEELLPAQARAWAGGRGVHELIDAFERAGARIFAARARALFGNH